MRFTSGRIDWGMELDELIAEEIVNPRIGHGADGPTGVDAESDSWLDAALLSSGATLEPIDD